MTRSLVACRCSSAPGRVVAVHRSHSVHRGDETRYARVKRYPPVIKHRKRYGLWDMMVLWWFHWDLMGLTVEPSSKR